MQANRSDAGFSLLELMVATAITLVVVGVAMTTFKDATDLNASAMNLADSAQNLRGGVNYLIRDLMRAGRLIPIGGISIPTGAGASALNRPSPPGHAYTFDNTTQTTLTAVVTGKSLGPVVDDRPTDMITILTIDPILDACLGQPLVAKPAGTPGNVPVLAADGSSLNVGTAVDCAGGAGGDWLAGNPSQGQPPVVAGDLLLFTDPSGNNAMQTVTSTSGTTIRFAQGASDPFNFNQRSVTAGSITQILGPALTVQRVLMITYYVDSTTVEGEPHLMRQQNFSTAQALAGVVEQLQLKYDLVDEDANPVDIPDLPVTIGTVTYSANQIRKVTVEVGVRSQTLSPKTHDYLRSYVSTVVSLRNLAFVDRYQ